MLRPLAQLLPTSLCPLCNILTFFALFCQIVMCNCARFWSFWKFCLFGFCILTIRLAPLWTQPNSLQNKLRRPEYTEFPNFQIMISYHLNFCVFLAGHMGILYWKKKYIVFKSNAISSVQFFVLYFNIFSKVAEMSQKITSGNLPALMLELMNLPALMLETKTNPKKSTDFLSSLVKRGGILCENNN